MGNDWLPAVPIADLKRNAAPKRKLVAVDDFLMMMALKTRMNIGSDPAGPIDNGDTNYGWILSMRYVDIASIS